MFAFYIETFLRPDLHCNVVLIRRGALAVIWPSAVSIVVRYCAMEFNADQIYEIVQKLIGKIRPVGENKQDAERLKNIETFIQVFEKIHIEIDDIAYQYGDRHEASMKAIADRCKKQLDRMGIDD